LRSTTVDSGCLRLFGLAIAGMILVVIGLSAALL
jgi:hypothetical protein